MSLDLTGFYRLILSHEWIDFSTVRKCDRNKKKEREKDKVSCVTRSRSLLLLWAMHACRQTDRQAGVMASVGGERKATGTMGEDTTGSTLTEALCFMLFFGLNRGKRLFLMAGGRPSGTCTWNEEEGDWRHRETHSNGTTHDLKSYFLDMFSVWRHINIADRDRKRNEK